MQTRSIATINSILDAAKGLFTRKQYADVTLREITEAAGVTKGALYHHFSTKEDLYFQTIHQCLEEVEETIEESLESTQEESCREQLKQALASFLSLAPDTRAVVRSIRRNINLFDEPRRTELIHAYQQALSGQVESVLAAGMANGEIISMDARLLAWQHIAVVEVSLYLYDRDMLGGPDEMAESIANLFFNGIASPENS